MIEEQVKYLLKDIELEIDNRAILVYLDTIRFARLKSTEAKAVSFSVVWLSLSEYHGEVNKSTSFQRSFMFINTLLKQSKPVRT